MQVVQRSGGPYVVRFISQDDMQMHSENIWFKWSKNGKWKTGDLVGPGDPQVPSGQSGQDNQSRCIHSEKSMVFMV